MRYVLTLDDELIVGNKLYMDSKYDREGKKFTKIAKNQLDKIKDDHVLYISSHGVYSNVGGVFSATNQLSANGVTLSPQDLFDLLKAGGLNNVSCKLKVFACFSAGLSSPTGERPTDIQIDESFAGKLKGLLKGNGYEKVTVYGYMNETMFGNHEGGGGHKRAGKHPAPLAEAMEKNAKDRRVEFKPDDTREVRWT